MTHQEKKDCVILLHGLRRSHRAMKPLEKFLKNVGYEVVNLSYPSTTGNIKELADIYVAKSIEAAQTFSPQKLHFVTHSLGGILVRQYFQEHILPMESRVVMLGPPNQGSEVVDFFMKYSPLRWLFLLLHGPAGKELDTQPHSTPNQLAPIHSSRVEIGVIAGSKSLDFWFYGLFSGKNDGKVSVERAQLKEMKDFLVMPCTHPFIMMNTQVLNQVEHFLQHGSFSKK